jgi:hypothetical protein
VLINPYYILNGFVVGGVESIVLKNNGRRRNDSTGNHSHLFHLHLHLPRLNYKKEPKKRTIETEIEKKKLD